jgi:hypothetical protein
VPGKKSKPSLKKYTIVTPVTEAAGHQEWTVVAASREEAMAKRSEWEFVGEEVEVQESGEPEFLDEEPVED